MTFIVRYFNIIELDLALLVLLQVISFDFITFLYIHLLIVLIDESADDILILGEEAT